MKGTTIMYGYPVKKVGILISAIALVAMVAERTIHFSVISGWNTEQHYYLFVWLLLAGLLTIAYTREKVDDERTAAIRLKAIQKSYMTLLAVSSAIGLMHELFKKGGFTIEGSYLLFLAAVSLIMYLITFYIGLYFDQVWDYENKTLLENLKEMPKNIWALLLYIVLATLVVVFTAHVVIA